jgi:hypothetical protein
MGFSDVEYVRQTLRADENVSHFCSWWNMRKYIKTRIILSKNGKNIDFFFITPSEDGSISFGSSISIPKEMKLGQFEIPQNEQNGEIAVNFKDVESISPTNTHFSYHPSRNGDPAIIHLRTSSRKLLFEYQIEDLTEMKEYRRIVTILPKNIEEYPLFTKSIKENDIVIPIDVFESRPFCVDIFLCKKDIDLKKIIIKDILLGEMAICQNKDYMLVIELYTKAEWLKWPKYSVIVPCSKGLM